MHSLIHSFICSFVHSFIPLFIHSFVHSFNPSINHSINQSINQSLNHPIIQSFVHSINHSFTHSLGGGREGRAGGGGPALPPPPSPDLSSYLPVSIISIIACAGSHDAFMGAGRRLGGHGLRQQPPGVARFTGCRAWSMYVNSRLAGPNRGAVRQSGAQWEDEG